MQDFFGEKHVIFWGKDVEKRRMFLGKSDGKKGVWEKENGFSTLLVEILDFCLAKRILL